MFRIVMGLTIFMSLGLSAWWVWDIQKDKSKAVIILKTTPLLSSGSSDSDQKVISELQPGESLRVLRIRYDKDYMTIKVERKDSSFGWVIYNSENMELVER